MHEKLLRTVEIYKRRVEPWYDLIMNHYRLLQNRSHVPGFGASNAEISSLRFLGKFEIFSQISNFSLTLVPAMFFFFLTRVCKFCDFPENLEIGKWLPPKNKTHVNSLIQNGREKTSATSTSQCRPF